MWHRNRSGEVISTDRERVLDTTRTTPITVEQAMEHTYIKNPNRSKYLSQCLEGAITYFEGAARLSIRPYIVTVRMNEWPMEDFIFVPYPPLVQLTSFEYRVKGSATYTAVDSSIYDVSKGRKVPILQLVDDESWPTDELRTPFGVKLVYTTGFTVATLPSDILQSILMLTAHYYMHRESVVLGTITGVKSAGIVQSLESSINMHRVHVY